MVEKANKIYRYFLAAAVAILIIAGVVFIITSKAWLLQTDKREFNAQIGKMEFEVAVNNKNLPEGTKWETKEISVIIEATTKIKEDPKFNMAVLPAVFRLTSIEDIPMNITTEITLPDISDNGILYMVLPALESYPLDKDYKKYIDSKIGVQPDYNALKTALNNYNKTTLLGYKSNMVGDAFSSDTKFIHLQTKGDFKDINILFWAEYDKVLQNNPNFNTPKVPDYRHLDQNFTMKLSARQVQDPVFKNIIK
ncbi:MAG: hypothetical protein RR073_04990 [Clostridia bacterium]